MYTFKRPQQQQTSLPFNGDGEYGDTALHATAQVSPEDANINDVCNDHNSGGECGVAAENETDVPAESHRPPQKEEEEPQGMPVGQLSEEVPAEEVLRYCREMIVHRSITPPPQWRRMRLELPTSIAELRLTPSAPEPIQQVHPITPSPCVVLQLDNCIPEGMTTKEYAKSLVKYVMDLLAFQRASTAITSLRFVKIGTELSQLVLTFGRDVQLASLMLREFAKVNLCAGFGAPVTGHTPNATFCVMDYQMTLHGGTGITAEDVAALLKPLRPPLEISVVAGYEPGLFYAAVKRPETVYAWLWNPFCSFVVQRTLFERSGVLVTMAECPHEFVSRGGGRPGAGPRQHAQPDRQQPRGRRRWNHDGTGSHNVNDAMMDSDAEGDEDQYGDEDEDEDQDPDDNVNNSNNNNNIVHYNNNDEMNEGNNVLGRGDRPVRGGAPEWARNAKEEIDIFGGLKQTEGQTTHLDFVDDDITELLHSANTKKQEQETPQQQQQQQQQHQQQQQTMYGASSQPMVSFEYTSTEAMLPAPFTQPTGLQQHQVPYPYYVGNPVADVWRYTQQEPPSAYNPQLAAQGSSPYGVAPALTGVYPSAQKSNIRYPELVDDSNDRSLPEHMKNGNTVSQPAFTQEQQPAMCWNLEACSVVGGGGAGGLYPPTSLLPYAMPPYMSPIHLPMEPQPLNVGMNAAPSILGQPAYGTSFMSSGVGGANINNSSNNNNKNVGILATPSSQDVLVSLPLPITAERASELAGRLVELTQVIFFTSKDNGDLEKTQPTAALEATDELSLEALFSNVPCTAKVPRMSVEMEDLMQFLEEQHVSIKEVIESSAPDVQESRRQIVDALLSCCSGPHQSEKSDWVQQEEDGVDTEGAKTPQLPALLPYLLTTIEGTEMVSAMASHDTALLLPLLVRYVLPFLLDASVVQSVCATALGVDCTSENPLVRRILRHWGPLTRWLHTYIQCQAASAEMRAEEELEPTSATATQSFKSTTKSTVVRRLTSQVGNTIDMLLASISPEQRRAIREHLDATKPLDAFIKPIQTVEGEETSMQDERPSQPQKTATPHISASLLWSADGAVHRSLLRLYLNGNLFNGLEVVDVLFSPQSSLTRDHYYFLLIAFSKSLVSPVLSEETARACGAFLRLMEQKQLNSEDGNNSAHVLTTKDADHLLDTALRALGSPEVYACLRDAYFASPTPEKRYEGIEAKLSRPTPPPTSSSTPLHQHQQHYHSSQQGTDGSHSATGSNWQADWTAAMRNYPQTGEPFTPLPTGWTSALSRSYGHYYFKNAKGTATYKHPTDAAEFMASPQAFLLEPGVSVTLADVLAFVNGKSKRSGTNEGDDAEKETETTALMKGGSTSASMERDAGITEELAEKWLKDQRIRVGALDMATLTLLKITYRVGSGAGRRSGQNRTRRSSRNRRESSERRRHRSRHYHHHHHSHQSRKRVRDGPCGGEELQRKLTKVSGYPARGHPFPPLPRGWTCNLSSSNGLYYFRPPRGHPIYRHPLSRCEYRASPQAFILHRGIHSSALATETNKSVEEVEKWLEDQRHRDEVLDSAAVCLVPIDYTTIDDDNDTKVEDAQGQQDCEGDNSHPIDVSHT